MNFSSDYPPNINFYNYITFYKLKQQKTHIILLKKRAETYIKV